MPTNDGPTRPIPNQIMAPAENPVGVIVAVCLVVALWAAIITTAIAARHETETLILATFTIAGTSTVLVISWGCTRHVNRRGNAGRRAIQLLLSDLTARVARQEDLLERLVEQSAKDHHDAEMRGYANALRDLTSGGDGDGSENGHVVSIGRSRVKREN